MKSAKPLTNFGNALPSEIEIMSASVRFLDGFLAGREDPLGRCQE
jgi:hypothetical protein